MDTTPLKQGRRTWRSTLNSLAALGAASLLLVSTLTIVSGASASATTTLPCNETVSTAPGTLVASPSGVLIVGVAAGTTQITISCNASSGATYALEASMLGGIATSTVVASNEASLATLATFAASATSVACPAATAGQCTTTVFDVPASFSATDNKAACPSTSAQIDDGLFACAVAIVNATLAPLTGGEFLLTYANQATPSAPSISATPSSARSGDKLTLSDAPGNNKFWFANSVQAVQAATLGTTPLAPPATCSATTGYGNVPTAFLGIRYFATGSTTPIVGSTAGITLSNVCYDGTTLYAPALSGTVTVPAGLIGGTNYTVYLCELNATIYPSNDANALAHCGAAPAGASWVDASFALAALAGTLTQGAPTSAASTVSASASFTAVLTSSGNTGAVTYTQHNPGNDLVVSTTGVVSAKRALAAGSYSVSGTTSDPAGDTGVFSFTLTVGALTQAAPLTASVASAASKSFSAQLNVTGGVGATTFSNQAGSTSLAVSSSGLVTTTGALSAGTYTVTAKTQDATGDAGTISFSLVVSASPPVFHVTSVVGHVVEGRTVTITILGAGFYAQPRVTSHLGTVARVTHDSGRALKVLVSSAPGSRNGRFTFTVTLKNGKSARIAYFQVA